MKDKMLSSQRGEGEAGCTASRIELPESKQRSQGRAREGSHIQGCARSAWAHGKGRGFPHLLQVTKLLLGAISCALQELGAGWLRRERVGSWEWAWLSPSLAGDPAVARGDQLRPRWASLLGTLDLAACLGLCLVGRVCGE